MPLVGACTGPFSLGRLHAVTSLSTLVSTKLSGGLTGRLGGRGSILWADHPQRHYCAHLMAHSDRGAATTLGAFNRMAWSNDRMFLQTVSMLYCNVILFLVLVDFIHLFFSLFVSYFSCRCIISDIVLMFYGIHWKGLGDICFWRFSI